MNQIKRRDAGLAYITDNAVFEEMQKCKGILLIVVMQMA